MPAVTRAAVLTSLPHRAVPISQTRPPRLWEGGELAKPGSAVRTPRVPGHALESRGRGRDPSRTAPPGGECRSPPQPTSGVSASSSFPGGDRCAACGALAPTPGQVSWPPARCLRSRFAALGPRALGPAQPLKPDTRGGAIAAASGGGERARGPAGRGSPYLRLCERPLPPCSAPAALRPSPGAAPFPLSASAPPRSRAAPPPLPRGCPGSLLSALGSGLQVP